METFVTMSWQALQTLLQSCHVCSKGIPAQVHTGSSVTVANVVVHPFNFPCCGTTINVEGTVVWHPKDVPPPCNRDEATDPLLIEDITEEEEAVAKFEDIIVKCEDGSAKKVETVGSVQETLEKDPLCVEEIGLPEGDSSLTEGLVHADASPQTITKNKPLEGILCHQDVFVNSNLKEINSKRKYPLTLICEFCGKAFEGKQRAYQFYYHRNREHTREKSYKCEVCSQEFWGDRELQAHWKGHKDEGHICHICGQKFHAKKNLKCHLLVHGGGRQHVCRYCDKNFKRRDHLTVHERIHTGVRPYQCQWCDSAYPQKLQLKLHMPKCPVLKLNEAKPLL